jgi:hypothetical protein
MSSSTSNLSVDEQHATAIAKRKVDDIVAQVIAATAQRVQEPLIAAMAAARKTLDEA